jgi:hypothetical protein
VRSPGGISTSVPTLIQTQVNPCDVQVLMNINMLVETGQPCAGVNDILPVRQAPRGILVAQRPIDQVVTLGNLSVNQFVANNTHRRDLDDIQFERYIQRGHPSLDI